MIRQLTCYILATATALPMAYAGWSSTTFNLDGVAQVGMAPGLDSPINSFANGGSDTDSVTGMTTPQPGPGATDAVTTSVLLTPGLVGQHRSAQTSGLITGSPDEGETLTIESFAAVSLENNVFVGTLKSTAVSTAQFIGEFDSPGFAGLSFSVDGMFGHQAEVQSNVSEPIRSEADFNISLLVENVTAGQTIASTELFATNILQTFFGGQNQFGNPFATGAFVPLFTTSAGDNIRVTLTATAFADTAVQEFGDPDNGGGFASAFFQEVNIRFNSIPEPGTTSLLLTGVFGIGLIRRRRMAFSD